MILELLIIGNYANITVLQNLNEVKELMMMVLYKKIITMLLHSGAVTLSTSMKILKKFVLVIEGFKDD